VYVLIINGDENDSPAVAPIVLDGTIDAFKNHAPAPPVRYKDGNVQVVVPFGRVPLNELTVAALIDGIPVL
jgi:hypothetical protein